jgi:hypothetical protein
MPWKRLPIASLVSQKALAFSTASIRAGPPTTGSRLWRSLMSSPASKTPIWQFQRH